MEARASYQRRSLLERRQRQPEEEDELEDKVEWEPVDNVDKAFHDSEESKDNPVLRAMVMLASVRDAEERK